MSMTLPANRIIKEATSSIIGEEFQIRFASEGDIPLVLSFIRELAEHERLSHEVIASEQSLRDSLFGKNPSAEVLLGYLGGEPMAFAVFFRNFSTFLGRPGLYLEDLYVKPEGRTFDLNKKILSHLARLAQERNCSHLEWWVIDWNEEHTRFYQSIGAVATDEWTVYRVTGESLAHLAEMN